MGKKGKGIKLNPPIGAKINYGNSITNGLFCYWLLNEAGGLKAFDSTNQHINGTLANGSTFNTTDLGSATVTVDMGTPTALQFANTQAFSFSCWVKYSSLASSNTLFAYAISGVGGGYYCEMGALGSGLFNFDMYDGVNYTRAGTTGFPISTGVWYHIVCVRNSLNNGLSNTIYINGIDRSTRSNGGTPNTPSYTQNFLLGARGIFNSGTLKGVIKNVALWKRALSPNEVKTLYANPYCMLK